MTIILDPSIGSADALTATPLYYNLDSPTPSYPYPYQDQYQYQRQQFTVDSAAQFVWYPPPPGAAATATAAATAAASTTILDSMASFPGVHSKTTTTTTTTTTMDAAAASSFSPPLADPPSSSTSTSPNSSQLGATGGASTSPSTVADARINTPSVPAACLACRGKHLKCDGLTPCSRCATSSSECIYVASRRGYKGPRRGTAQNPNKRHASSSPRDSPSSGADGVTLLSTSAATPIGSNMATTFSPGIMLPDNGSSPSFPSMTAAANATHMQLYRSYCSVNGIGQNTNLHQAHPNGLVPTQHPVQTPAERCLDAFYHFFHAAHPFALPKHFLIPLSKEVNVEPLLAAMRWVGSLFIDAGSPRQGFYDEAYRLAYEPGRPRDGFLVQALMLLILGLDGSCQQEKSREILADVERMAVQIALNTRPFATLHGRGMPVLEESWRRTWWDLFVMDGMIAGVHRMTNFLLFDVPADVALPCEEAQFLSGNIPQPMYLEDLEDSDFSGEDRQFSSFSYRILCGRNLGKFMRVPPIFGPEDENLARIEALLTNWRLHLPAAKRDALHKDGQLDEMIFQAHMMHHATSIMLHQPHSQLDSSPARDINSCAPHRDVASGEIFNTHTKHTIQAANEISKMVTHRVPLLSHTHFFTCVVTLSSIVHLSKWALYFVPHDDDDLRQQIRLNLGALHKLSEVWHSAFRASGQVKGVAQEIYRVKKQQQLAPQFWMGLTQEEVLNTITTDDSIFNDIESILPNMPDMMG